MKKLLLRKWYLFLTICIILISMGFITTQDRDFKIVKNLDIFYSLFRELNLFYVDDIDPEELINNGIEGMMNSLDPYTNYIPESEIENFKLQTTGEYGGIGALIRAAGEYTIISEPYEGFPAHKAGLRAGDTIYLIDGKSIKGKLITDVSELLKGTPNTPVKIKYRRYGQKEFLEKTLLREKITLKNVLYYTMITDETGYILLSNFTIDAGKEVKEALIELKKQNAKSIILDLRGNPGGLLVESVNVANVFVGKGQEIVSTRGRVKQWDNSYLTTENAIDTSIRLTVLVSRGSASASEIVAGSIQDLDRGVIIGQRTFGKGLVQTTRPLSYNSQLKVTTAKYYIPSGRCIQAIDYSHRNEDGSVGYIPDSLISEFKTKHRRIVYDGGGIQPDIEVLPELPANITIALYSNNMIFDFATIYCATHDSVASISGFTLTDANYNDFISYIESKHFDYSTKSYSKFEELVESAKQEKYYQFAETEFNALKEKLKHDLKKDLNTFKTEIKNILTQEIISRYFFQKGRIQFSLENDNQLKKAIEIAGDNEKYLLILKPISTK